MAFSFCWLLACTVACGLALCGRLRLSVRSAFLIGLVARVVLAVAFRMPPYAIMRFDLDSMRIVADLLSSGHEVYAETIRYPYLPLQMYVMAGARWLATHSNVPFEVLVRLPAALADAAIVLLIASWRPAAGEMHARRAALVYAFNPLSLGVTAIHGQFDALPLCFLVASLLLLRDDTRIVAAGGLYALAILEKPWPLFLLPLTVLQLRNNQQRIRFLAAGAAVGLLVVGLYFSVFRSGFAPMLDVLGRYGGVVGDWGLSMVLRRQFAGVWSSVLAWPQPYRRLLLQVVKLTFLAGLVAISALLRQAPRERAYATVVLAFYVLTYGWGFHYQIWLLPFFLLAESLRFSALYLGAVTLSTFLVLFGIGGVYFGFAQWGVAGVLVYRLADSFQISTWLLYAVLLIRSSWLVWHTSARQAS